MRGEGSGLQVDAAKAGAAAGTTAGKSFASKLGAQMKTGLGMGAGIGAFNLLSGAASKATDFLVDSTKAAIDEEAQIGRLSTALKANAKGWDGNIDAIERRIDANKKMAFSDDEQRDALTKLIPVTGDVNDAFNAQAVAMDLARLKGIPLEEAAGLLTKAFNGQMKGLKDLGINVKDVTTKTEILAAVEAKAAGQAKAFAEDHAGAAKRIGDAWADFGENVGGVVLDAVDGLAEGLAYQDWRSKEAAKSGGDLNAMLTLSATLADKAGVGYEDYQRALVKATDAEKSSAAEMAALTGFTLSYKTAAEKAIVATDNMPPAFAHSRRELDKLAQEFKDTARVARDNRLDEAYDIAELPIKIRNAKREVADAQKELEDARTGAQKDAARLRLLEAERDLANLRNALADKAPGLAAVGRLLGTAYGRALFLEVSAWNRRTSNIPLPNPRYPSGNRNIDRSEGDSAGGPVRAGQVRWVGENGPELLAYSSPAYVLNHQDAVQIASGGGSGGGNTYNVYITNPEPRAAEPDIGRVLRRVAALGMA